MLETTTKYKDTPIGKIPVDWEIKKLGEVTIGKGVYGINASAVDYQDDLPRYLRITDIDEEGYFSTNKLSSVDDENSKDFYLQNGDLIFVRTGSTTGKSYLYDERDGLLVYAGFLIKFSIDNKKANDYYIWNYTKTTMYYDWVQKFSQRSGQPGLNSNEYSNLLIPFPPLPEQQKIAEILSTWDKAIQETGSIIKSLEKRNKALAYSLLTGRKRVQAFESEGWKVSNLGFYIEEYRKKPIDNSDLPVFTSSKNGLMMQSDYYSGSRMLSREDVDYNILPNGFITYRSRSDDGLFTFNRNDKGLDGLISGYYPVFEIANGNADFFLYFLNYFKSKLTKYSSGTSQLVLSIKSLKTAKFNFPTHQEQSKIAEILNTANKELQQYQQKLNNLKTQKKGLMQQLLTGKVRTV